MHRHSVDGLGQPNPGRGELSEVHLDAVAAVDLSDADADHLGEAPEGHEGLRLRGPSPIEGNVSDGTLRLLALTLLAYLPGIEGVFLIEEPENGIHPRAVETVFQSLSSVYGAQVLLATHSPVVLSIARPEQVLCFAKTADGATDLVRGSEHPRLKEWKGETDLGTLFASGVLG